MRTQKKKRKKTGEQNTANKKKILKKVRSAEKQVVAC